MDSVCERQRQMHEEIEFLERAVEKELLNMSSMQREKINGEHRVKRMMESISEKSKRLMETYEDKDGFRAEELRMLSSGNPLKEFNLRLQSLREYHRKNPGEAIEPLRTDILIDRPLALGALQTERATSAQEHGRAEKEEKDKDKGAAATSKKTAQDSGEASTETPMLVSFTDEEGFGKFLDLHAAHTAFINIKGIQANDYITYLRTLDNFAEIPKQIKASPQYKRYLEQLNEYMLDFLARSQPLLDLHKELQRIHEEFETDWAAGICPGWPKAADEDKDHEAEPLDLTIYTSAQELEALGGERLKSALTALGLKCGGTVAQRAQRLFLTKTTPLSQLDKGLFAGAGGKKEKRVDEGGKALAEMEFRIMHLLVLSGAARRQSIEHVELRMARTAGELEEEHEAELQAVEEEEEEEQSNDLPYNPKGLPLGWDGKPIPYWLYKLHGLNIKYNCEICGNQKYMGPKAFQKHFQEWKHASSMRRLGIPNTAHFAYVTKLEDATSLWEKLKKEKSSEVFQAQVEEEFEDSLGNVVDKKTYELLAKQGLL